MALQLLLLTATAVLGAVALPRAVPDWGRGWPLSVAGAILVGVGGLAVFRGSRDLGPNLTAMPRPRDDAVLVLEGAYARIRHPMYAGLMALAVGWALLTISLPTLVTALALLVVLDLKARREEVWLAERYPDYGAYLARSRRFIPGVY